MIRKEEISFNFIQKEPLTGSYLGMRYYLVKSGDCIRATVYPDKFCFVKTPEDQKVVKEFPNVPDSMDELVGWLNEQHESGRY
ncbi:GNAT family acetyltransferase [Eisenbergiella sp.]